MNMNYRINLNIKHEHANPRNYYVQHYFMPYVAARPRSTLHEEMRHLRLAHLLRGFSSECMMQFFIQFDVAETRHGEVIISYSRLRQRILDQHH